MSISRCQVHRVHSFHQSGQVICFIDELRTSSSFARRSVFVSPSLDTLFNLGKAEGSIDAGQMIKPALARGLQLVGATTRTFFPIPLVSLVVIILFVNIRSG